MSGAAGNKKSVNISEEEGFTEKALVSLQCLFLFLFPCTAKSAPKQELFK